VDFNHRDDPKSRLVAAENIDARVDAYDETYGILPLRIDGGQLLIPALSVATGEGRRLRIAASDVNLSREAPHASSILNALPARIHSKSPVGMNEVLVVLALGLEGGGAKLLARLTRRSWDLLGLAVFRRGVSTMIGVGVPSPHLAKSMLEGVPTAPMGVSIRSAFAYRIKRRGQAALLLGDLSCFSFQMPVSRMHELRLLFDQYATKGTSVMPFD
jgi:hypothetical protein